MYYIYLITALNMAFLQAVTQRSLQLLLVLGTCATFAASLSANFYEKTCPNVESLVFEAVHAATKQDPTAPAGLLRMHFHDCFIEGCDASILIDSTTNNQAEKDAPPNVSLHGFYVIDNAKAKIEAVCPKVVSCADILAIAARDAVVLSGGPSWQVMKGRLDGRVSQASKTRALPAPTFNVSQLLQSFGMRKLSLLDMVTLSGGHTLGFSHCSSFNKRLFGFSSTQDIDPSMEGGFAQTLRQACPLHNTNKRAGVALDDTRLRFDNRYYADLVARRGVFASDQSLLSDPRTRPIVQRFARRQPDFFASFATSMRNMGNVGVKTAAAQGGGGGGAGAEVRTHCRTINNNNNNNAAS